MNMNKTTSEVLSIFGRIEFEKMLMIQPHHLLSQPLLMAEVRMKVERAYKSYGLKTKFKDTLVGEIYHHVKKTLKSLGLGVVSVTRMWCVNGNDTTSLNVWVDCVYFGIYNTKLNRFVYLYSTTEPPQILKGIIPDECFKGIVTPHKYFRNENNITEKACEDTTELTNLLLTSGLLDKNAKKKEEEPTENQPENESNESKGDKPKISADDECIKNSKKAQDIIKFGSWHQVTDGFYRYVFASAACYEIIVEEYKLDSHEEIEEASLLEAQCTVYCTGRWTLMDGESQFVRELITTGTLTECLLAAAYDYATSVTADD